MTLLPSGTLYPSTSLFPNQESGQISLAGTIAATSTVTGVPSYAIRPLAGTIASTSSVSGTLSNVPPPPIALQGTVTATSSVTGNLTGATGVAILDDRRYPGSAEFPGTNTYPGPFLSATSTVTGDLFKVTAAGTVTGTSTVTGSLTVRDGLAGTVTGTSTATGALSYANRPLAGTITATSTVTGGLLGGGLRRTIGQIAVTPSARPRPTALEKVRVMNLPVVRGRLIITGVSIVNTRAQGDPRLTGHATLPGLVHARGVGALFVQPIAVPALTRV